MSRLSWLALPPLLLWLRVEGLECLVGAAHHYVVRNCSNRDVLVEASTKRAPDALIFHQEMELIRPRVPVLCCKTSRHGLRLVRGCAEPDEVCDDHCAPLSDSLALGSPVGPADEVCLCRGSRCNHWRLRPSFARRTSGVAPSGLERSVLAASALRLLLAFLHWD